MTLPVATGENAARAADSHLPPWEISSTTRGVSIAKHPSVLPFGCIIGIGGEMPFLDQKVTIIRNTKTTAQNDFASVPFSAVISRIQSGEKGLDFLTATAQNLKNAAISAVGTDKADAKADEYRTWKANNLPAVIPAGVWDKKVDGKATHSYAGWSGTHTGYITLDFDNIENIEELTERLRACPYVFFLFISPSGKGVKVFISVDPLPKDRDEHKIAWDALKTDIEAVADMEVAVDKQCKNINRLCYLAHDPDAYVNEAAEVFKWKMPKQKENSRKSDHSNGAFSTTALDQIREVLKYISADDREDWINVGHAMKNDELPFSLWNEWSRTSPNFNPSEDMQKRWDGFKPDGGITWEKIVRKAQENGLYQVYETAEGKYAVTSTPLLEPEVESPAPVFPEDVFVGGFESLLKAYEGSRVCKPFIFAMGITAVGVTVGRKAFFSTEPDLRATAEDFPNTYSLIIGPTTVAAKSETRDMLAKILRLVHDADAVFTPYRYINTISSREGLAVDLRTDEDEFEYDDDMFAEGVRGLISLDEAKHLLDNSRREVTKNMVADLNELWRCPRDNNVRTKNDGITVDYPVISIFGCSTQDWLEESVIGSDIDGGFINRFMPFMYERMPYIRKPKIDVDAYTVFVTKLRELLPTPEPEAVRHLKFTDEAYEAYHKWAEQLYDAAVENPRDAAITARTADHARRIGLCLSLINNDLDNDEVDLPTLQAAQKVAEYLADVARYVFKNVTASKEAQVERKILDKLTEMGNEAKANDLLMKMPARDRPVSKVFHQLIDGLVFSGRIEVIETRPKTIRRVG